MSDHSSSAQSRPDQSRRARGRWGEDLAAAHLVRAGFVIVERNWLLRRADARAEVDIIARRRDDRGDLIVFCEVKARRSAGYGGAALAVDAAKQARLRLAAELFLIERGLTDIDARFDVIAITGTELSHYEGAF